ncbi:MAG: TIR-like protein FxsC [Rubrivivax sp.]
MARLARVAYEFFFSYTRANNDAYLKRFFDDLSQEVRHRRGLGAEAAVGFFDQRSIELGEEWDAAIVEALNTSKVMLALASPAYFKSEYCGREWALFRRRCRVAAPPGGKTPPLLKTVLWYETPIDPLPAEVKATQMLFGDPAAPANRKGVYYLLKRHADHASAYADLIDALAQQIVEAADAHPLPPLAPLPTLAQTPSAFAQAIAAAPAAAPAGPRHVSFIYVAAHPAEIAGARPTDAYVDAGGGDWRPFYPADPRRVHPLMQHVASDESLDFSSAELPFGPDLLQRIETAWQARQIVVLVVDPWSLHWDAQRQQPAYQDLLRRLDGRLDVHWCVLVPWNEADPAGAAERDAIQATVHSTFDRHVRLAPNPTFFRSGIRSADDLKSQVREVLQQLKAEVLRQAPVVRPVPAGPARAQLSGAGA